MEPLAHTLVGATLAESGLKHRSRYATATLLIGANLPDVDAIAEWWGQDVELYVRRGWSHGILAMLVLPLVLAAAIWLWHRWRGGGPAADAAGGAPPFRPRAVIALSFLAVWSHPFLDWLNTYGVRLLMPFDSRWFYGDTLFIVDPWLWLLASAGVVMARSATRRARAGWALLAALTSALVLVTDLISAGVKLVWCVGLALLVALRWRRPAWAASATLARAGLAALVLYVGAAYGLARAAEARLAQRFAGAEEVQANPAPGVPFRHRVVVVDGDVYRTVAADGTVHELPRQQPDAIVREALASESIRGFVNWMRFPYWTVEETADGWIVRIRDLRYVGPDEDDARGIGFAQVTVPRRGPTSEAAIDLQPAHHRAHDAKPGHGDTRRTLPIAEQSP